MYHFESLDQVRGDMVAEVNRDISAKTLYISGRLNDKGKEAYPRLLLEAASKGTEETFTAALNGSYFNSHEERRKPKGGTTMAAIPKDANEVLCTGEFNRFYIRGVCVATIRNGLTKVQAYRARHSDNPRTESISLDGQLLEAVRLLDDLRKNPGVDTALGLPPGPRSGMSARMTKAT